MAKKKTTEVQYRGISDIRIVHEYTWTPGSSLPMPTDEAELLLELHPDEFVIAGDDPDSSEQGELNLNAQGTADDQQSSTGSTDLSTDS